ncbi:MAG: hypothetical protein Q9228_002070 [Teloschistes exilis]
MFFQGKVVIDEDQKPIIDWPIPFCLSSQVEGGRLEAMARQIGKNITKHGFKARMPPAHLTTEGKSKAVVTSGALGMRRLRFRDQAGLLPFDLRLGSDSRKRAIVQCIPPASMVDVLLTNSTRALTDFSIEAQNYVSRTNRGASLEKAGKNRVTVEQRKSRHAREDELLEYFEPPNPSGWPCGDDIMDDRQAIATARAYVGESSPVGLHETAPTNYCREVEEGMSGTLMLETNAKRSQDDDEDDTIDVSRDSFKRRRFDEHHQDRDLASQQLPVAIGSRRKLGGEEQMSGAFDSNSRWKELMKVQDIWHNSPVLKCSVTRTLDLNFSSLLPEVQPNRWPGATTDFPFLEPSSRRVGEGRGAPASLSGARDPPWSYSMPAMTKQREYIPSSRRRRDAIKSNYHQLRKDEGAPAARPEADEDFLAPFSLPAIGLEKAGGHRAVAGGAVEDFIAPFPTPTMGLKKARRAPVVEAKSVGDFLAPFSPFQTPAMNLEKASGTPAVEARTDGEFPAPATDLEDATGNEANIA